MTAENPFAKPEEKSMKTVMTKMIFSHVGLFFIVALYTCFGAQMFVRLEYDNEVERYAMKRDAARQVQQTIDYTTSLLWFYGDEQSYNWTFKCRDPDESKAMGVKCYTTQVKEHLDSLESFILEAVDNNDYDGTELGWTWDWNFMNSLLLCMTILTTIGYGNISPVTYEGQMFCICYALIGCPLFLVFLANLGESMATGFTYIYSRCCCRCCRSTRYISELPENVSKRKRKHVIDDVVGNEEYMPTSKMFVPIIVNIVILHLYFLLGGLLFASWEHWDRTTAMYFSFVTLSTIGYGDYVPGNTLTDDPESLSNTLKLLVVVLYIVIGMALLSMCVNLMQEQIVDKCRYVGEEIGMIGKSRVTATKPIDKRKDSLMPLMDQNKGTSPFRSDGQGSPFDDVEEEKIPGIIVA